MKGLVACVILMTVVACHGLSISDLLKDEWEAFKSHHSKSYLNEMEERFRMKIYLENRQRIAKHNKNSENEFTLKVNKYADLLPHEFKSVMNGYRMDLRRNRTEESVVFLTPENYCEAPKSVDWREKGFVTPVKDQGQCGSCWSFSATGSLEGQHMRKTGKLISLSEQNLVDCSTAEGNEGCNGGLMDNAFRYVKKNKGIDTETSYPYEGQDDQCRFKSTDVGADDKGFVDVPEGNERALKKALATVGPISVAIDASHETFQFYEGGVYFDKKCSSTELDHGVLLVGYGTEEGKDYWLVKNSWGESWGDGGYIKMARNKNNHCGIASQASYPLV